MDDLNKIEALQKSDLFCVLKDEELDQIAGNAEHRTYQASEEIVWEGEPSDTLFVLLNGIAVVKKIFQNEPDKILAYLMPGNSFGEVGILENKPRSATVGALTEVDVITIPKNDFEQLLLKYPQVGIELAKLLGHYLTETNKRFTRGDVDSRVVLIYDTFGATSGKTFGETMAKKLYRSNQHATILIDVDDIGWKELPSVSSNISQHPDGFDVAINYDQLTFPKGSRISMLTDRLLNDYQNLVVRIAEDINENLSVLFENVNQVIILTDEQNRSSAEKEEKKLKKVLDQRQVKIFTVQEMKKDAEAPLFKVPNRLSFFTISDDEASVSKTDLASAIISSIEKNQRIGIFIPTTFSVDQPINSDNFVNEALNFLGTKFGGATSEEAMGVWNSQEKGIVGEKVFIVHSYTSSKAIKENLNDVVSYVQDLKNKLQQESMALEINKRLTLI